MKRQCLDSVVVLEFSLASENPDVARSRGCSGEQNIVQNIALSGIETGAIFQLVPLQCKSRVIWCPDPSDAK